MNQHEEQIREALEKGVTADEIQGMLTRSIERKRTEMRTLKEQLTELYGLQNAYNDVMNIIPKMLDDSEVRREQPANIFMTSSELKVIMDQKNISSRELARAANHNYQSILDYRRGVVPIPRDIADFVRNWKI